MHVSIRFVDYIREFGVTGGASSSPLIGGTPVYNNSDVSAAAGHGLNNGGCLDDYRGAAADRLRYNSLFIHSPCPWPWPIRRQFHRISEDEELRTAAENQDGGYLHLDHTTTS